MKEEVFKQLLELRKIDDEIKKKDLEEFRSASNDDLAKLVAFYADTHAQSI